MTYNIEEYINQIIALPYFQKLKTVIENSDYHDHENVYDHLIKTKDLAQKEIAGEFITDAEAKKKFLQFIEEDIEGIKRKDIMVLTALIHDIGKILQYEEDGKKESINIMMLDGKTRSPGHEYYGSTIIPIVLKDIVPEKIMTYVAQIVKLHDTFNLDYFEPKKQWNTTQLIRDVKARAEGKYIECLFNIYCDGYSARVFKETKERIVQIFNSSELYIPRKYYIPE